jgi:hypothetical protein
MMVQQSKIYIRHEIEPLAIDVPAFRTMTQTISAGDIDLTALAKLGDPGTATKVSTAALEQYLNASNPICSG